MEEQEQIVLIAYTDGRIVWKADKVKLHWILNLAEGLRQMALDSDIVFSRQEVKDDSTRA